MSKLSELLTEEFIEELQEQRAQVEKDPYSMLAPEEWEEEFMDFSKLGPLPEDWKKDETTN